MKQKKQFVAPAVTIMNMQVETSIMAGSNVTTPSQSTIRLGNLWDWK